MREHAAITERLLRKPYYYQCWYCCVNRHCQTTLIMPPEFIVWRGGYGELPRDADIAAERERRLIKQLKGRG